MKKMLLLLLFAICTIGYRSESIMQMLGLGNTVSASDPYSIRSLTIPADKKPRGGMSLTEYAELAKTDPDAYRKLFQSNQQKEERSELDKLMNYFTRLKHE
jgi:hypothetical protein